MRRTQKWLMILIVIGLLTVVTGEIAIRVIGGFNADGQFVFRQWAIPPLEIPKQVVSDKIAYYLAHEDEARQIYDPQLGWVNQPDHTNDDAGITINSGGLRAEQDYDETPADDTLRIAVLGDSFVFGDEVRDAEAFVPLLEAQLREQGLNVEVMNFGVAGYGIDQIYLSWSHWVQTYEPDWVIHGFIGINMTRNQNIFRPILIPFVNQVFTKPRFILEDDTLALVNSPALPPDDMLDIIDELETHPIFAYEGRYDDRYQAQWWQASKLLATLQFYSILQTRDPFLPTTDALQAESIVLTDAILDQLASDVTESGGLFSIAYLPMRRELEQLQTGDAPYFWSMLASRDEIIFWGQDAFPDNREAYWAPIWHYSPTGNQLMADFLADELLSCIAEGRCTFDRFASPSQFGFESN